MVGAPFHFNVPLDVFKSGDDGRMLFGGFVSSEKTDRQGEKIIQKGLNFDPWADRGWFNDNHEQSLTSGGGVIGIPVEDQAPVRWLAKGDKSPLSGSTAERAGWFVMGELLDTAGGRNVFETSQALQKASSKRRLGMSLEGKVHRRKGTDVLKADVINIAITQRPVSHDTVVECLQKALETADVIDSEKEDRVSTLTARIDELEKNLVEKIDALSKALAAGQDIDNPDGNVVNGKLVEKGMTAGVAVDAPAVAAPGDGFALRTEQLDKKTRKTTAPRKDEEDEKKKKTTKKSEDVDFAVAISEVKAKLKLNDKDARRVTERIFRQLQHQRSA